MRDNLNTTPLSPVTVPPLLSKNIVSSGAAWARQVQDKAESRYYWEKKVRPCSDPAFRPCSDPAPTLVPTLLRIAHNGQPGACMSRAGCGERGLHWRQLLTLE